MPAGLPPLIIIGLVITLSIGVAVYLYANRTPNSHRDGPRIQPLFGSDVGDVRVSEPGEDEDEDEEEAPPPVRSRAIPPAPATAPVQSGIASRPAPRAPRSSAVAPDGAQRSAPEPAGAAPRARATPPASGSEPFANSITAWTTTAASASVPGKLIEGHLVRYSVPNDGTLQFLPGRLEVSAGNDSGREIRFVRLAGPDGTVVTFGRSEGPLYRHVQLNDLTVSRAHARMRLADGHWHLANLSQTNPIAHNGRILGDDEEQLLEDGDRIEMGEVVFRFRSR